MPANDTGRMYCEIYSCHMSMAACITRQDNARKYIESNAWGPGRIKPGALDINCQNCEQGRRLIAAHDPGRKKIVEKPEDRGQGTGGSKQEEFEMKICKEKDCEHGGRPQPTENFQMHKHGGRLGVCKSCMNKKRLASRLRKQKGRQPETKIQKRTPDKPAETPGKIITLCFDNHPEIYNDLIDLAAAELRTPENQAIFILKKIYENGRKINEESP